jgi:hypothetical protein
VLVREIASGSDLARWKEGPEGDDRHVSGQTGMNIVSQASNSTAPEIRSPKAARRAHHNSVVAPSPGGVL